MVSPVTHSARPRALRRCAVALSALLLTAGCGGVERDNPFDASTGETMPAESALSLAVPLPKALATVVDSLVARLEVPDAPVVIKSLSYTTPLGPAVLTIGALSPSTGVTLTIEGYDLTGRMILSGTQTGITIAANDTTRISIDLRLTVSEDELDVPDDQPAEPGTDEGADSGTDDGGTDGGGTDTGGTDDGGTDDGGTDDGGTDDGATDDGTDDATGGGDTTGEDPSETGEETTG